MTAADGSDTFVASKLSSTALGALVAEKASTNAERRAAAIGSAVLSSLPTLVTGWRWSVSAFPISHTKKN